MGDPSDIPVVDFSKFALDVAEGDISRADLEQLAEEICEDFRSVGFLYLKNHGIPEYKVEEMHDLARRFFSLDRNVKMKYSRRPGGGVKDNYGWVTIGRENLNKDRPGDLKELFDIQPRMRSEAWPDEDSPGFKGKVMELFMNCTELVNRVLYLMGVGLKLQDPELFRKNHNPMERPCSSHFRMLCYPVYPDEDIKRNQIRCGEHTDNGMLTMLFQDEIGGLEVKNKQGEYIAAKSIPGTIVLNLGDLMERWTADQLPSTWHRVVKPTTEAGSKKARISAIYAAHADEDCLIECIDGSNKYAPITAAENVNKKYASTFAY